MSWYLGALKNYADFGGRARRREYWYFTLFNTLALLVLVILDVILGTFSEELSVGLLEGVYILAVLIPSFAVSVRRLHDTDRSGWWLLIGVVPFVGGLALLVLVLLDSQPGPNEYGPNPKESPA